jgi:hypothetical protein
LLLVLLCVFNAVSYGQVKVYTGKINNKYAIEMHLLMLKDGMYGYYFYKSINNPIPLHLSSKKDNKLLERDDQKENVYFEILQHGNTITGNWHDEKNKKCLPFSVTETSSETISVKSKKISGNYLLDSLAQKELDIYSIHDNIIYFELTVVSGNCTGNLNGIANRYNNTVYYSGKDCGKLFFDLYDRGVVIREHECSNAHGKNCSFEGIYIKQGRNPK